MDIRVQTLTNVSQLNLASGNLFFDNYDQTNSWTAHTTNYLTFSLFSAGSYANNFSATNPPALGTGLKWNWNPAAGTLAVVPAVNLTQTSLTATVSRPFFGPAGREPPHPNWGWTSGTEGLMLRQPDLNT